MFQFTIRDVLWLTLTVALAVAWWGERGRANRLKGSNEHLRELIETGVLIPSANKRGDY